MDGPIDQQDTALQLAFARFQGTVLARLDAMSESLRRLDERQDRMERTVDEIVRRLTVIEAERATEEKAQRSWRSWLANAREWLAYVTTAAMAAWSVWRSSRP